MRDILPVVCPALVTKLLLWQRSHLRVWWEWGGVVTAEQSDSFSLRTRSELNCVSSQHLTLNVVCFNTDTSYQSVWILISLYRHSAPTLTILIQAQHHKLNTTWQHHKITTRPAGGGRSGWWERAAGGSLCWAGALWDHLRLEDIDINTALDTPVSCQSSDSGVRTGCDERGAVWPQLRLRLTSQTASHYVTPTGGRSVKSSGSLLFT